MRISRLFFIFSKLVEIFSIQGRILDKTEKSKRGAGIYPLPFVQIAVLSPATAAGLPTAPTGASAAKRATGTTAAKGTTRTSTAPKGAPSAEGTAGPGTRRRSAPSEGAAWTGAPEGPAGPGSGGTAPAKGTAGAGSGVGPGTRAGTWAGSNAKAHAGSGSKARTARARAKTGTSGGPGRPGPEDIEGPVNVGGSVPAVAVAAPVGALHHQQENHRQHDDDNQIRKSVHKAASFPRSTVIVPIPDLQGFGEVQQRLPVEAVGKLIFHILIGIV